MRFCLYPPVYDKGGKIRVAYITELHKNTDYTIKQNQTLIIIIMVFLSICVVLGWVLTLKVIPC